MVFERSFGWNAEKIGFSSSFLRSKNKLCAFSYNSKYVFNQLLNGKKAKDSPKRRKRKEKERGKEKEIEKKKKKRNENLSN